MNPSKRVVLIGSAYPLRGGLASFNERIIKEFQDQGYEAEIYTFSLQYPKILFPGKTQYSLGEAPANLKISVKVNSINPFNWIKVGYELKNKRPDLIIVKFWIPFMAPCFGTIVRIAKRNKITRVISIVDNIIPHEHRPGDRILAKFWVNSADAFIAMSKLVLSDLRMFTKLKPAAFCPHPIYDNYGEWIPKLEAIRNLSLSENFSYILFFGFIRDYKGLDILISSFSNDKIRKMPLKLIVAGEFYCDPKPYYELIEKLNLTDKILLSNDFIPESKVVDYFCAADIIVQPYKSATQSGVTQIAYNYNKPMIITKVGGLEEFVTDNLVGYVVSPDSNDVAKAIIRFYTEKKEKEFIENVKNEKLRFSWTHMFETIKILYNSY